MRQDFRLAFRSLVRAPAFTATSVLTLALGAGATAAMLAVVHGLWTTRFGGDRAIVGRTVQIDGQPFEIVAVMPRGFEIFGLRTDAYTPTWHSTNAPGTTRSRSRSSSRGSRPASAPIGPIATTRP